MKKKRESDDIRYSLIRNILSLCHLVKLMHWMIFGLGELAKYGLLGHAIQLKNYTLIQALFLKSKSLKN